MKRSSAIAFVVVLAVAGCGHLPRNAPPVELMSEAVIPGLPQVRAPAARISATMTDDLVGSFAQESAADFPVGADGVISYPHLALSGGGANGAFGAGLLNGWTKTGQRPTFKIVTGVSTGALMAPFAFLGPEYDQALREFYTTTSSRGIFRSLSILPQLIAGESLADTGPLRGLIEKSIDAELLRRVADAHAAGRRLYLGTADLDSQRFVVWNMGLIATSGQPAALDLFRKVMLASASVPVAFPPVLFEVEVDGRRYDEMHVDGGVGANVFLNGGVFRFSEAVARSPRGPGRETVFVVHNGQLLPVAEATPRSLRGIATRSFEAASKAAVLGDLFRIYAVTRQERAEFRWTTIPEGVPLDGKEFFDPVLMRSLYDLGYELALNGIRWRTAPVEFLREQTP